MATTRPATITVDVDGRSAAWTALDPPRRIPRGLRQLAAANPLVRRLLGHTEGLVAAGVLVGDPQLTAAIADVLGPWSMVDAVTVAQPNVDYPFTPGRDTAADVAAAMIWVGSGRSRLSPSGWVALEPAITGQLEAAADAEDGERIY